MLAASSLATAGRSAVAHGCSVVVAEQDSFSDRRSVCCPSCGAGARSLNDPYLRLFQPHLVAEI